MNRGSRSKASRQVRRQDTPVAAVQTASTSHVSAPPVSTQALLLQMQRQAGNAAVNHLLQRMAGAPPSAGGPRRTLQRHICGPGCGHLGSSLIQRQAAATKGSTVFSPSTRRPAPHVQRDLAGRSSHVCTSACRHSSGGANVMPPVQRHSSWEHRALGDIEPEDLQIIAGGRDVKAGTTVNLPDGRAITQQNVNHALEQELRRLEAFRDHPPKDDSQASVQELQQNAKKSPTDTDPLWDVRLLHIPFSDGTKEVLTYGEMNTMADLFGNPEEMKASDPGRFHQLLQGIRSQSYFNLLNLYNEVRGTTTRGKASPLRLVDKIRGKESSKASSGAFSGGVGSTGEQLSPVLGELNLMGVTGRGKYREGENILPGTGKGETDYSAGLGRNACHFAPESWHSWAQYHTKARVLAQSARTKQVLAEQLQTDADNLMQQKRPLDAQDKLGEALKPRKESKEESNEALLQNGFGDHFLQDSYAAGHLINKTQIMMWFVNWLEGHPEHRRAWSGDQLTRYKLMANQQSGLGVSQGRYDKSQPGQIKGRDAQSAEDIQDDPTTGTDWTTRFKALGLKVPDIIMQGDGYRLLTWWQSASSKVQDGLKAGVAANQLNLGAFRTKGLLMQFVDDGIATSKEKKGTFTFTLDKRYRVSKKNRAKFNKAITPTPNEAEQENRDVTFNRMAAAVTYSDYHSFLNNAYLQLSTNVLHNRYCSGGLKVTDTMGGNLFKIYGDDAMFQTESDKGVRESATTARMSRDSIYSLLQGQAPAQTPQAISARFPSYVQPEKLPGDNGDPPVVSLEGWHTGGSLKKVCDDFVFPETANGVKSSALSLKGKITGKIAKDDIKAIHSGEAF